ncbi:hypothetical protein, partial [Fulvivirga aurantia]|uniref:hypothetical protein n=1 Tax=Fulvivirga aurantia TaxID=2529383 RepID=UPI0016272002
TIKISDGAVTDEKISAVSPNKIAQDGAATNQVLKWNGTAWSPADDAISTGGNAGTADGFSNLDPSDFEILLKNNTDLDKNHLMRFESNNSFVSVREPSKADQIIAPVHLPHNAELVEVTIYYMDFSGGDLSVDLFRKSYIGGSQSLFGSSWSSTGSSGAVQSATISTISNGTIDNENYTYRLIVDFNFTGTVDAPGDAEHRIYGVKFKYTQPGNIVTGPGPYQTSYVGEDAPPAGDRYVGMVWIDTDSDRIRVWTGSGWNTVANND